MKIKQYYYVDGASGEVVGPHTIKELKELEFTNDISSDSQVLEEGTENWLPFNQVVTAESLRFYETESKKEQERKLEEEREKEREKEREREREINAENELNAEKEKENNFLISPIRSIQRWLVVLVILTAISGGFSFAFLKPRIKWEYMIVAPKDSLFESTMDDYGAEGWELISARRATSKNYITDEMEGLYECILKRIKK